MSASDRLRRLLQIVRLLQTGRAYNSAELAQECGVSRRTVFRDLSQLEQAGIICQHDPDRQGYRLQSSQLLPPTDFTLEETLALLLLCNELGGDDGIPFQSAARAAVMKLQSNLPDQLRNHLSELAESITVEVGPRNPLTESQPVFDQLTTALNQRQQIRIHYRPPLDPDGFTTILNPYHILFKQRSWYVIGRSSLHKEVRIFNVGRVQSAEELPTSYKIPQRFRLETFLGNAWSLIPEKKNRCKVRIRFRPLVARNVSEVQWHKTQELHWNEDGTLDFTAVVDGLTEIRWWILGYGDQAEVLEPPELRAELRNRAAAMLDVYKE